MKDKIEVVKINDRGEEIFKKIFEADGYKVTSTNDVLIVDSGREVAFVKDIDYVYGVPIKDEE